MIITQYNNGQIEMAAKLSSDYLGLLTNFITADN